ncbi:MAG: metallophosphatase family protein [Paramuribaculum sp.]|nr:metallophosphatase family protein [Paramuribaculum sp.]
MTRIGILSDTHSCWDERYLKHFSQCDEIWHAGDVGDSRILMRLSESGKKIRAVSGNIDHGDVRRLCPEVLEFQIEGLKILLTHIGGYPGRYSPGMESYLKSNDIGLMVCGHSHILKVIPDHKLGLLHINPGAAGWHGWQKCRTLIRIIIDEGKVTDLEVIELGKY